MSIVGATFHTRNGVEVRTADIGAANGCSFPKRWLAFISDRLVGVVRAMTIKHEDAHCRFPALTEAQIDVLVATEEIELSRLIDALIVHQGDARLVAVELEVTDEVLQTRRAHLGIAETLLINYAIAMRSLD